MNNTPFDGLMSLNEAAERWDRADATLRQAILRGKFTEGMDAKHIGKQWIITEAAMRREYGEPKNGIARAADSGGHRH